MSRAVLGRFRLPLNSCAKGLIGLARYDELSGEFTFQERSDS